MEVKESYDLITRVHVTIYSEDKLYLHTSIHDLYLFFSEECPYGFAMVSLWKLVVCAETQAECVFQYAVIVDNLFRALWPCFSLIGSCF